MSRSPFAALFVALVAFAIPACSKTDKDPAGAVDGPPSGVPVGAAADTNGAPGAARTVPTNLSRYGVYAEIALPEGAAVEPVGIRRWSVRAGDTFDVEIGAAYVPLAATKTEWATQSLPLVRDEPDVIVAEYPGARFRFEAHIRLGASTYAVRTAPDKTFPREETDRMIAAARSLRQTDEIKAAIPREAAARAALKAAGCRVEDTRDGPTLIVAGDKVTDGDLASAADSGVLAIWIQGPRHLTPAGIALLAAVPTLERLLLNGPLITDVTAAPFRAAQGIRSLKLERHRLTDNGLAFLGGLTKLTTLTIDGRCIPNAVPRLTGEGLSHLRECKSLRYLAVTAERLTDASLEHVGAVRSLRELYLERVPITDAGLRHLEALQRLESVSLVRTPVRGNGLATLAGLPGLRTLRLTHSEVTDGGFERLRGARLTGLDVSYTAVTDRGLRVLPELPHLQAVDLRGCRLTDAGLAHVARLPDLRVALLDDTDITGSGFSHFKARPTLQWVSARRTLVGDAALAELPGVPNLESVSLADTLVSDAGLAHLHAARSLKDVDVSGTDVTAAGADRFRAARPQVKLGWAAAETAAAAAGPVAPPVLVAKLPPADPAALVQKYRGSSKSEEGTTVVAVSLAGSAVTDEELGHLRDQKALQSLDLSGCQRVTDAGLAYLSGLTELRDLRLKDTNVIGTGLAALSGLRRLTRLDLPDVRMTLSYLAPLSALQELEHLRVTPPGDEDGYLRFLAAFPRLKYANLESIHLTPRRMELVGKLTGLERLHLKSDVGDRGLAHLRNLKGLKELYLSSELATDAALQHVGKLTGLKVLELSGIRFTDLGFQHLRELTELERLKVTETRLTDRGLTHLREFRNLIEIELAHADVTDRGLRELVELKNLEFIDLSGTRVTDDGLKHFAAMEELRTLKLEDTQVTGQVFAALRKLPRLYRVRLSRSAVNDQGLGAIAQVETLEQIELDECQVTDAAVARLKALPNLKHLSLAGAAQISDKIVDVLKAFPALQEVTLRGTKVSAAAVTELRKKEGLTVHVE